MNQSQQLLLAGFVGDLAWLLHALKLPARGPHPREITAPQSLSCFMSHQVSEDNVLRHQTSGVTGSNPTRQHPEMSPVLQAGGHLFFYPVALRRRGGQCWIFHWGTPLLVTVHETSQVAWCPQPLLLRWAQILAIGKARHPQS